MIKEASTSSPSCIRRCHHHQPKLLRVERRGDRAQSSPPHRVLLLPPLPSRLGVGIKLVATVTIETATIISKSRRRLGQAEGKIRTTRKRKRTLVEVFLAIAAKGSSAKGSSAVITTIAVPILILKNLTPFTLVLF
ncbi:hypothetical protein AHAS_Ahas01G0097900 [Arachis hypogaea]